MKKKLIVIGLIVFVFAGIGIFCFLNDNIRFKISYEFLNLVEDSNGKNVKVNIPFDNRIKYLDEKNIMPVLENETGIVYFGYISCPWCRSIIESLISVVKENDIKKLYYVDVHSNLNNISSQLYDYLDDYVEERDGKKGIPSPSIFFIKDGNVVLHYKGSMGIFDYPYKKLSLEEKQEIKRLYQIGIEMIK